MARQRYETEIDLMNERVILDEFLALLETRRQIDYLGFKLPDNMHADYLIVGMDTPKRYAVVEIKRRRHKFGDYPDLMISKIKWDAGKAYHELGFKFFILIQYDDGSCWYLYDPQHKVEIKEGGRTLRTRDKWDIEECAYIPNAYWKKVKPLMEFEQDSN